MCAQDRNQIQKDWSGLKCSCIWLHFIDNRLTGVCQFFIHKDKSVVHCDMRLKISKISVRGCWAPSVCLLWSD